MAGVLSLHRRPAQRFGRRCASRLWLRAAVVGLLATGVTLQVGLGQEARAAGGTAQPAGATATAKIKVVFKSVTISTAKLTYGNCTGGSSNGASLGFPNGRCTTAHFTVRNGGAPSTILVAGSDATPSDGGKRWSLCGPRNTKCSADSPGMDQFSEKDSAARLGLAAACDRNFSVSPCGSAKVHQAQTESLELHGPRASTDRSPTFITTITWTAT